MAVARDLPAGRHRAGDRHLKIHDYRDNLARRATHVGADVAVHNAIESMIEICRDHSTNVKRWRDGQMALRWCAAGMHEAATQFRRVNGHLHLAALRVELDRKFETVTPARETQEAA